MRIVTDTWKANQRALASAPSRLSARVEIRGPEEAIRQTKMYASVTHPGGTNTIGQLFTFSKGMTLHSIIFTLSRTGWGGGNTMSAALWSVDINTYRLQQRLATGTATIAGNFTAREVTYQFGTGGMGISINPGFYAVLLLAPPSGTLEVWYAVGNRYTAGDRVSSTSNTSNTPLTVTPNEDLTFRLVGNISALTPTWCWNLSSDPAVNNVVSAKLTSAFDPSGATLPIESCSITINNKTELG